MEIIDIGLSDLETFDLNVNESKPSVNFGPGIELLMNEKKMSGSGSGSSSNANIDLGDMEKLERDLNDLTNSSKSETRTISGFANNLFNFGGKSPEPATALASSSLETDSKVGEATANTLGSTKTWDGFSKMVDVPDLANAAPRMTDREKRRKKRAMIKKLEEWYEKGLIKHSSHFNMDSPYDEIEDEYESVLEDKRKKDSVKLQGWWFMTFINSIEYANAVFDPFGLNLDGWGEQISEDIDSYDEIFNELHEKYKGGKLSPEISLLLRIGFSAAVVNITNKALSTATPGFNDVIRQSPELMKMFTNATVQSMNQQMPGAAFVNNILRPEEQVNTTFGVPPPAVNPKTVPPPPYRPGMQFTESSNRPDIDMGRNKAPLFREGGVEVGNQFEQYGRQERSAAAAEPRAEMRGPQSVDVNALLTGLKVREVNIHNSATNNITTTIDENDSMVSISSLKDSQNTTLPKRTNRRKQRSDKNVVSLDI